MLRMVSVKKLFFLLLWAIIALLLVFFIHGPFLEPGVEEAVVRAVLSQAGEPGEGQLAAEGHKVFQATEKGNELTVYGMFSYGLYDTEEGDYVPGGEAVPARITFHDSGSGGWELQSYEEAGIEGTAVWDLFPVSLRPFLLLSGLYDSGLEAQLRTYFDA